MQAGSDARRRRCGVLRYGIVSQARQIRRTKYHVGNCRHVFESFFPMSTLTPTRKVSRKHELREDKVVTFSARALGLIENNRAVVYSALAGVVIVLAAILGNSYMQSKRNAEALDMMTEAVSRYERGDYTAAVDGDMSFAGLIEIADDYGNTKAGNLARFYAADALYRTGDLDEALEYFEAFKKGADYLGASALAGEAAIHETKLDHARAADLYLRAAEIFESVVTSPDYLVKAGRAYENAGDFSSARRVYEKLKADYSGTSEGQDAEFYLARISGSQ